MYIINADMVFVIKRQAFKLNTTNNPRQNFLKQCPLVDYLS